MQNIGENVKLGLIEDRGIVEKGSVASHGKSGSITGSRLGKRAAHARYWPAMLIAMIVVPMVVVLGFYATVPAKAAGPAPVIMGSAADFVILAETGISTTGTTAITGDIGVSPYAASFITGFGLILDSSGTFSTSSLVTGSVYAADYTDPTPSKMTTAVNDMQTAYTDAAGRTNPDATELGAGDITNLVISPGLYKWGTGVLISAAGVTLSGGANGVWIFQIAQDLTVADNATIYLTGGAQAANVYWQVAGQVTIGTTAHMKGTILCQTLIAMNTGSTLEGRALAQSAVTTDSNTIVPPDVVIPEFSQVLIPLVGMMFVVAIASTVRNQRK